MIKLFSKRSGFFKNVTTLVTGTALAQLINILSTPLLTRIYSPEEFAVFQLFYSTASIFAVVATLRYEVAIMAPEEEEEALDLVSISFYSSFLIALISLLLVLFWKYRGDAPMQAAFNNWYFLLPLYIVFAGLLQSLNILSLRRKTFTRNLMSRVGSALIAAVSGILMGWKGWKPSGLLIGSVTGQFTGFLCLLKDVPDILSRPLRRPTAMKKCLRLYKNYPVYNAPHALIDTFQDQGLVFFLNHYFVPAIVSYYGQAFRVLKAPIGFIGSALYQVVFPKFTEMSRQNADMRPHVRKLYIRLAALGLPGFILLWVYAESLFAWFFGKGWEEAGTIAGIMAPWLFLNFLASPVSCFALIRNKQRQAAIITITEVILRFSAIIAGGYYGSYILGFTLLTLAGSLVMLYALVWYYRLAAPLRVSE
ncbi:MAG: oligosaccharide flippase family protein [Bacteroidia bacterium]|nr:oligosaccharide flippase family protein [Bacteroidia bacterium]